MNRHVLSRSVRTRPSGAGPRLLVLGAGFGARASLASARRAGFHVIAADAVETAGALAEADEQLVIAIDDPEIVTTAARLVEAEGIIATTDHAVQSAAIAARALGLPGIDPQCARRATSKALMRQCWQTADIPGPTTVVVSTDAEVRHAVTMIGYPVVVKPANALGGGSRGVSMARSENELASAVAFARCYALDGAMLVEQCIDAISEHSIEILFVGGTANVIAIGDKVKTPAPYRVDVEVRYPSALAASVQREAGRVAAAAARTLGIDHGMAHVELAVTRDGLMLFELGARCGGGATAAPLVPWVTGVDEFVEASRVACGMTPHRLAPVVDRGGCYRFIVPTPGTMISHARLDAVRALDGVLEAELWVQDHSLAPEVRTGRDRSGAVVTGAATRNEAIELANRAASIIETGRVGFPGLRGATRLAG